jgi:hypothetical protein
MDRACASGAQGQRFESSRARHLQLLRGESLKQKQQRESVALRLLKTVCPPPLLMKIRAAYLSRQILDNKAKPERAMEVLHSLVKPGDSVADLGANIGMYALDLSALVGPA